MRSSRNSGSRNRGADRAQAEDPGHHHRRGPDRPCLHVVGLGPGDTEHLTVRALDVIKQADVIAGYTTYIDLIRDLIAEKEIIATSMKKEVDRVDAAIRTVQEGRGCALVCSGDPGVYAMAGLVFEMCEKKNIPVVPPDHESPVGEGIRVEVVPGIPALAAGASLLGAPLTHDFACISLSDLLTPWDVIEKRIEHAAAADFVIVIFNPKSKKRDWQLAKARDIILQHRHPDTPVGLVRDAMRDEQAVAIVPLTELHNAAVDMRTTVFIGSAASRGFLDFMYTPRGYAGKYELE